VGQFQKEGLDLLAPLIRKPFARPLPPRIKVSYPKAMTIGIMAHALELLHPRIAACCDWLVSDECSSSETTCKLDDSTIPGVICLVSGGLETSNTLKGFCAKGIAGFNYQDREDLKARIHESIEGCIESLAKRKRNLDGVEFLLGSFLSDGPVILRIGGYGVQEIIKPEIGVIGIGAFYADPFLRWRTLAQPVDHMSNLDDILYRVLEAKRFSETSKDVGRMTTLAVFQEGDSPGGFRCDVVPKAYRDFLDEQIKRYGPQLLPKDREHFGDIP
jgi:hypothetical protein